MERFRRSFRSRMRDSGREEAGGGPSLPLRRLVATLIVLLIASSLLASGRALGQTAAPSRSDSAKCEKDPAIVSCQPDATTQADLAELQRLVREQFVPFAGEGVNSSDVRIRFIGKGRTADFSAAEPVLEATSFEGRGKGLPMDAWRLFNPATQNEFELSAPRSIRSAFDDLIMRSDPKPRGPGTPSPEGPNAPFRIADWSGGVDDRVLDDDNEETYPWSTIANMGNCTSTFIGPRHIVTAGHCIYFRGAAATATQPARPPAWTPNFSVQPSRDASNVPYSTSMPPGPGETGWYFTPVGWRDPNASGDIGQFDFAIVVVPDRLGDQVSWMGYGTLGSGELQNGSPLLLRGYPLCESETAIPGERIDEPRVAGATDPDLGCVINGFYRGNSCSVAAFTSKDADGWNRRVNHGCDGSAANSGSALYAYVNGDPMVTGIHTTSTKCRRGPDPTATPQFAGDQPCTASDTHTLVMTRITPEYRGWISYFRKLFP